MILPRSFYLRQHVVTVARDLLGKYLVTESDGILTSGLICETEAYAGVVDRASHAFGGKRSARTEIMYREGGTAYVYLCYGMHALFNVVTNVEEIPHAILVRGVIPADGAGIMLERAGKNPATKHPGIGPGKVTKLLGINILHTGLDITQRPTGSNSFGIWIEDRGVNISLSRIKAGPRIGVDYAGKDALLPYRFWFYPDSGK